MSKETNPHLSEISSWIINSPDRSIETTLADEQSSSEIMWKLHIPEQSYFGSFIRHFGGIEVGNGLLRILGASGGKEGWRDILSWNQKFTHNMETDFLLIGDNIFGSFYAVNLGGIANVSLGEICVLDSEILSWETLEGDFGQFLNYVLSGDYGVEFGDFEALLTNVSHEKNTRRNQGFSFYPPFYAQEGSIEKSSHRLIDISELCDQRLNLM